MPITLRLVDDVQSSDHRVYGGAVLSTCTSGFGVRRYIGHDLVYGLSTAGHCRNDQDYGDRNVLDFVGEHQGDWGDAQWHTSSEQISDDFYNSTEDTRRDTAAVGHAVVGQYLCRYGKTTGRRCDNVYSRNHCNNSKCRLSIMDTNEAQDGDSGGPWYWGDTAYGIHQGELFYFGAKDTFTPVTHLDEALGLEVLTEPGPKPK